MFETVNDIGTITSWDYADTSWKMFQWRFGHNLYPPGGHLLCGSYEGCAAPKGHFLSPDSLAKGMFSSEVLSQGYIFHENP